MNTMANQIVENRSYAQEITMPPLYNQIYNFVSSSAGTNRTLTNSEYTRETINTILDGCEKDKYEDFFPCPSIDGPVFEKFAGKKKYYFFAFFFFFYTIIF